MVVSLKRVITILDVKSCKSGEATREFLSMAYGQNRIQDISNGDVKSIVVTDQELFLSPISSLTLMKRADFLARTVVRDL